MPYIYIIDAVSVDGYLLLPFFLPSGPPLQHSSLQSSLDQSVVAHRLIHSGKSSLQGASANEIKKCYYSKYNKPRFNIVHQSNFFEITISNNTFLPNSAPSNIVHLDKKVLCIRKSHYDKKSKGFHQDLYVFHPRLMQEIICWIDLSILGRRL